MQLIQLIQDTNNKRKAPKTQVGLYEKYHPAGNGFFLPH